MLLKFAGADAKYAHVFAETINRLIYVRTEYDTVSVEVSINEIIIL